VVSRSGVCSSPRETDYGIYYKLEINLGMYVDHQNPVPCYYLYKLYICGCEVPLMSPFYSISSLVFNICDILKSV
jgi:hypothetical protein